MNFIDLSFYPQFSLRAEGEWSKPILGGVGCNFFLGRKGNFPTFSNNEHWNKIEQHLRDMNMGMLRVGFLPSGSADVAGDAFLASPWDDKTQTYDPNHDFFKIVKWLDCLAGELNFPIMIDPWFVPRSMQIMAKGLAECEGYRGMPKDMDLYAGTFVLPFVKLILDDLDCQHVTHLGLLNQG